MKKFFLISFIAAAFVSLYSAGDALAHAFPDHSDPKVGATLKSSPAAVRIWFDDALDPASSKITVTDRSGKRVDKGDSHVSNSDPKLLEVGLPQLPPGAYKVNWNIIAHDGYPTKGDFSFTIK